VRPNIILILVDTLRADHLSCYAYGRRTSPCIDRIAEESVVFENAISSAPWTPPSHASLFTGTYPSRHGVTRSRLVLDPALAPLPEVLRRHGYRTYGVSSNYWLSRETHFDRGFDEFLHSWQLVQTTGTNEPLNRQQQKQDLGLHGLNGRATHGAMDALAGVVNTAFHRVTQKTLRSLRAYDDGAWRVNRIVTKRWLPAWQRAEQPFFAFLHYMEPHIRYWPPGRFHALHTPAGVGSRRIRRVNQNPWRYVVGAKTMDDDDFAILRGLYDGEISYVDHRIGELYGLLRDRGILDSTVLVFTSDHGENLGEHRLMDHQYCLYDTLLRVPLVIRYPNEFEPGRRVSEQVRMVDLFPTLLRLAGIGEDGAWSQAQGEPLFPADVRGGAERFAIAEYLEPQPPVAVLSKQYPQCNTARYDRTLRAIRTSHHKFIWASDGKHELYDLRVDPHEERNVITGEPETAAALQGMLEQRLGSIDEAASGAQSIDLDPVMQKRLKELGYLA
jgi:arylsulfatase A-like enzyme